MMNFNSTTILKGNITEGNVQKIEKCSYKKTAIFKHKAEI